MDPLFRVGRTFTYSLVKWGWPKPVKHKYTLVEGEAAERAAYAISFLKGRGRWPLTGQRFENATHFFNTGKGGNTEDDTAFLVFPRNRFAELVTSGATPWTVAWGEGEKTTLERQPAKPYRIRVDGKLRSLPVVGASAGDCRLFLLDDPEFPLVLEHDEPPYPMKLLYVR